MRLPYLGWVNQNSPTIFDRGSKIINFFSFFLSFFFFSTMLKTSISPLLSTLVTTSHRLHSYLFRVLRYPYTLYIRPQNSHQLRFNFSLSPPGINPLKSPPSYWLCFISRLHTPPPNLWLQHNHYLQLIHLSAWPTSFNLRQALPSAHSLQ